MLTVTGDLHILAELAGLTLDLDAVMEELFESGTVENTVCSGFRVVDDELVLDSGRFGGGGLRLDKRNGVSLLRRDSAKR